MSKIGPKAMAALAALLAIGMALNGADMLIDPQHWYANVPGVAATGAFNHHFIRDIGLAYLLIGAAFAAGIVIRAARVTLWLGASAWLAGHALFHFWEVSVGICGPDAIIRDFPGVTLPALIGVGLTLFAWRIAPRNQAI